MHTCLIIPILFFVTNIYYSNTQNVGNAVEGEKNTSPIMKSNNGNSAGAAEEHRITVHLPRIVNVMTPDARRRKFDELLNIYPDYNCYGGRATIGFTEAELGDIPQEFHTLYIRQVAGDGHCLFRSLSYLIAGHEDYHVEMRQLIVAHESTIVEPTYEAKKHLHDVSNICRRAWGTDDEINAAALLLRINIYLVHLDSNYYNTDPDRPEQRLAPNSAGEIFRIFPDKVGNEYIDPLHYDEALFMGMVNGNHFVPITGADPENNAHYHGSAPKDANRIQDSEMEGANDAAEQRPNPIQVSEMEIANDAAKQPPNSSKASGKQPVKPKKAISTIKPGRGKMQQGSTNDRDRTAMKHDKGVSSAQQPSPPPFSSKPKENKRRSKKQGAVADKKS